VAGGHLPPELGDAFFLVDPLDGTKEFINKRPDFTVNIALVRRGVPDIGVVYAPAAGKLFGGRPGRAELIVVGPDGAQDRAHGDLDARLRGEADGGGQPLAPDAGNGRLHREDRRRRVWCRSARR
jgi:fructose-1,6-bisphosphatase/inositol monophosphatase family enzyme